MQVRGHATALLVATLAQTAACEQAPKRPKPTTVTDPKQVVDAPDERRDACLRRHLEVDPHYDPIVRAFCADLQNLDGVGASLALVENGRLTLSLAGGRRCEDREDPVDARTQFRIGSITKTLTAATTLNLAREGKLELDAPVTTYLPELRLADADAAPGITLRHLLGHTSGLPELSPADVTALDSVPWYGAWSSKTPWFDPGALWSYSNSGYALLGQALHAATGTPYPELVEARVLEPLALADTTFDAAAARERGNVACGHHRAGRVKRPLDVESDFDAQNERWALPAGAALSTAEDLASFAVGLMDSEVVLDQDTRAEMFGSQVRTHRSPKDFYGLGIAGDELAKGLVLLRHAGNTGDFAADLYMVPDRGFALVILGNTSSHFRATADATLRHTLETPLVARSKQDPPSLAAYAGDYRVAGWDAPVRVTVEDDTLRLSSAHLRVENLELRHLAHSTFRLTWPALGTSERVTFVSGASGTWARARSFVGHRP